MNVMHSKNHTNTVYTPGRQLDKDLQYKVMLMSFPLFFSKFKCKVIVFHLI